MKKHIKRSISLLLVLVMVAGFLCEIPAFTTPAEAVSSDVKNNIYENMLADYNPSFETLNSVKGWNGVDSSAVSFAEGKGVDGTYALYINDASTTKGYSVYSDDISVTPGEKYMASVKVSGKGQAKLYLRFYDAKGTQLKDADKVAAKTVAKKDGWAVLEVTGAEAPAKAVTMRLCIAISQKGTAQMYFDDVFVNVDTTEVPSEDKDAPTDEGAGDNAGTVNTVEPFANKDFEAGTLDSWTPYAGADCSVTLEANAGKGAYSAKITDPGVGKTYGRVTTNEIAVQPGQQLCLSVDTKMVEGTFYLHAYFKDANGASVAIDPTRQTCATTVGVWKTTIWLLTVPENAVKMSAAVASAGSGKGTGYVDGMTVLAVNDKEIMNANFEAGTLAPWTLYNGADCSVDLVENAGKGTYSAKITDPGVAKTYGRITSNKMAVQAGKKLCLSVDTKMEEGTFYLHAYFYDADGKSITIDPTRQTCSTEVGEWRTTAWQLTVPENAVTMTAAVASAGTGAGTGYVDNMTVFEITDKEIMNPDFETGTIAPWSLYATGNCTAQVVKDAGKGTYSVKITDTGEEKNSARISSNEFVVQPKQKLLLSVDTKMEKGTFYLHAYFKDAEGKSITIDPTRQTCSTDVGKWKTTAWLLTVPENAATMSVAVASAGTGAGTGYVDNFKVAAISDQQIVNADFEAGMLDPWEIMGTVENGCKYDIVKDAGKGAYSAKIEDTGDKTARLLSNKITVAYGQKVNLSVDTKLTTKGMLYLYVYFQDANGNSVTADISRVACGTELKKWQTTTLEVSVPKGAVTMSMAVASSGSGKVSGYVDNAVAAISMNINNPGFEREAGVFKWNGGTYGSQSTQYASDGQYSLCINDPSEEVVVTYSSEKLPVTVGNKYCVSVDALSDGATTQLYLRFYNKKGEIVSQKMVSVVTTMDAWTPLELVDIEAPKGATHVGITLATNAKSKGKAYFDNVYLYDSSEKYRPADTLVNPDFESGSTEPWFLYVTKDNTATVSKDKATKNNQYSLLIQDNSEGVVQVTSKPINVKAGETYGFYMESFMVGTGAVRVSLRYYDANGEIVGQDSKPCSGARDMWKKLVMHLVAPEGAVIAKITLSTGSSTLNAKAYIDNMVFAKQGDKNFPDLALDESSHNPPSRVDKTLENGGFETGSKEPWNLTVDEGAVGEITTEKAASGKYSLKIVDQGTQKVILNSQHLAVEAGKQYGFTMQTYLKGTTAIKMYVRFYDKNGSQIAEFIKVGASEQGAWKKMVMLLVAPEGAKTVKITIATGSSSKGYDLYLDNVTFSKEGDKNFPSMLEDETGEISMPTPMTRPNWGKLQATSHPRLYFNSDELETIKKFAQNSNFTSYGFSGKSAYESLIKVADQYVEEDTLSVTARNTTIKLNGRKLMDPIKIPEFQRPPEGFTGAFPYLENYSKVLYGRMQTLAMAYSMTGDAKYANRCIQYMSDMAEWTYWTDFIAIMGRKHWDEDPKYRSSMDTAYLTIGVATAYDMCYDAMTNAQREKISAAVISKGLEQMYIDLEYTSLNNKLQHRASAMIFASIAIATNENIPELEKYLIRGYRMTEWYFDAMLTYGNQEGYSYTNNVIDFHMEAVKALGRFTNDSSLLTHRLINEVVVDWVVYFMRPGDGYLPGISDANSKYYFVKTMCVLSSELENPLAGYYLTHTSASEDLGAMERLIYGNKEPVSVEDEEEVMIAANTLVEEFGYGSLRTGFDKDDTLLVMIANESEMYHNQYDQMSFVLGSNSQWLLDDPGYPTNMGDSEIPSAMYGLRYGHNTYVVDEKSQVNKGQGSMDLVLDTDLVGELHASAPGAYEKGLLTRAERNAIQINHKDASYYVMIDDFASNGEHVYGWNLNSGGWKKLTVDGTQLDVGTTVQGHEIAIAGDENDTFVQFVSNEPVEVKPYLYNDEYGPMLRVNSDKAKEAQFMTVINTMDNTAINGGGAVIELVDTIDLFNCTAVWSNDVELETDVKEVAIDSKNCVFYRGQNNGDWIEFPFNVEQAGEYYVSANMGKHGVYGIYNIYLDGELVYEAYDGYSSTTYLYKVDLGHRKMEYGEHKIRLELVGKNPATTTATIGIHGVILEKERIVNMNENTLNVLETYDDANMLGGKISYLEGFTDVVLYNRGEGELSADLITASGKQATLLGIDAEQNYEGFSLVDGTSMVIGDKTMFTSDTPISAALDLREGYIMSTFGEKDANVKLNVNGYCYTVMIDGEAVPSTKDGDMICFAVPAGNHAITFEFACEIDSYTYNEDATCRLNGTQTGICNICGNPTTITAPGTKTPHKYDQEVVEDIFMKSEATCTEAALYYLSCACGRCNRKDTFAVGEPLGHQWDGNVCSVCGEHQDGENDGILLWIIIGVGVLALAAGGVTIFLIAKKKKKQQEEVPADAQVDEAAAPSEEATPQGEA